MRLTNAQLETLRQAKNIADTGEYDGIAPMRGGQRKMFARLEGLGLLAYDGEGEGGGFNPRQVSIYKITDAGRRLIETNRKEQG